MAINFVKNDDIRILRDIEQYYSTQIDEMPMNGRKQPITRLLAVTPAWAELSDAANSVATVMLTCSLLSAVADLI